MAGELNKLKNLLNKLENRMKLSEASAEEIKSWWDRNLSTPTKVTLLASMGVTTELNGDQMYYDNLPADIKATVDEYYNSKIFRTVGK